MFHLIEAKCRNASLYCNGCNYGRQKVNDSMRQWVFLIHCEVMFAIEQTGEHCSPYSILVYRVGSNSKTISIPNVAS